MKKLLIALISLVVVVLLVAAIAPKEFKIEKEVVINKPVDEVFAYLKIMKNGDQWNPWIKKDPNVIRDFKGTDGTVGFISSWSGNKEVGVGEQEIKNIVKDERIDFELRFKEPMQGTNQGYFVTESLSKNQTKVKWGMTGSTPFPMNIICFFMHGKVGKEFQQGLDDLKVILEK